MTSESAMDTGTANNAISTDINTHELMTLLVELRDHLTLATTNETKNTKNTTDFRARLLAVATPQQSMNEIIPFLFPTRDSSNTNTTLSYEDAWQLLGFLVSSKVDIVSEQPQFLIAASKAMKSEIQKLRLSHDETAASEFVMSSELIDVLLHQACTGMNVEVSQNCHESLVLLCQLLPTTHAVISSILSGIVTTWSTAIAVVNMNSSGNTNTDITKKQRSDASTICVRCAALIVDIAVWNDQTMQATIDVSALDLMMQLFKNASNDPLLQISLLDLFNTLALTRPTHRVRAQWFLKEAVIRTFLNLAGVGGDAPDPFLGGPVVLVLASICGSWTNVADGNDTDHVVVRDDLIRDLHSALRNFDTSGGELDRLNYIDAVSSLASTSSTAMTMVLDDPMTRDGWLSLSVAQPKIKSAILVSIAHVLESNVETEPTQTDFGMATSIVSSSSPPFSVTKELCMKLFSSLGLVNGGSSNHPKNTTELLLNLVRSPLPEIRLGVYRLFQVVAKYSTGGQVLLSHSKFYDFLIQRDHEYAETTYEGRVMKYSIVQAIYNNTTLQQLLSNEIKTNLERCIAQGPHYKQVLHWEVMTAEQ
jgi:Proteasome non-ATPase 26S subunit